MVISTPLIPHHPTAPNPHSLSVVGAPSSPSPHLSITHLLTLHQKLAALQPYNGRYIPLAQCSYELLWRKQPKQ
ncbi:hypothetical protein CEN49_24710 [Fischerella thermalis CCMEE 5273]|nr:hypothetical protein CEN49_24710 [Fischerella thermalis CCMEE 5273]